MGKKRQHYINQVWNPYPVASPNSQSGRVEGLRLIGHEKLLLRLSKAGQSLSFELSDAVGDDHGVWSDILIVGDIVEVIGSKLNLLAPCLNDSPPLVASKFSPDTSRLWSQFISRVRSFYLEKAFCEIATPSLVSCPGMETNLDVFKTELSLQGSHSRVFLPTSPEFHLKKALCIGYEKIFEIAKVFRNNEFGNHHQNEFWMLEWYRSYESLNAIEEDLVSLCELVFLSPVKPTRLSVAELFLAHCDFTLRPETSYEDLLTLAGSLGLNTDSCENFDDVFYLIFIDKIEGNLKQYPFLVLHSYPPSQAALSRVGKEGWAERFEFYCNGIELANAFHELNDPREQKQRFEEAIKVLKASGAEHVDFDRELISWMEYGMPPSSGIALGLDRLFMAVHGLNEIGETRLFPR